MESTTLTAHDVELKAALHQRGESTGTVGLRDLKRYYTLLKRCLETLYFSEGEAALICDALKDYQLDKNINQIGLIWADLEDSIQINQLDKKWGVNGQELIHKCQSLTPCQVFAVADAVEKFWFKRESNPQEKLSEALLGVALVRECCDYAL